MSLGKILITGGAGFIGSHLAENLMLEGAEIVVLDNLSMGNKMSFPNSDNISFIKGDVRDLSTVLAASKGCDRIVHLAAIVGVEKVIEQAFDMVEVETIGTFNIAHAAIQNNIKKVLYSSSSAVYHKVYSELSKETDPLGLINTYAVAKRLNEKYLEALTKEHGISTNSMRFFNVYGGRQDERMVVPRFFNQAMSNKPIEIFGKGSQTRDFTYIDDVIVGIKALLFNDSVSGVFNISRGVETTIADLAILIKETTNSDSEIRLLDFPKSRVSFKVDRRIGSAEKLLEFTGYKPHTFLNDGLEKYFETLAQVQAMKKRA